MTTVPVIVDETLLQMDNSSTSQAPSCQTQHKVHASWVTYLRLSLQTIATKGSEHKGRERSFDECKEGIESLIAESSHTSASAWWADKLQGRIEDLVGDILAQCDKKEKEQQQKDAEKQRQEQLAAVEVSESEVALDRLSMQLQTHEFQHMAVQKEVEDEKAKLKQRVTEAERRVKRTAEKVRNAKRRLDAAKSAWRQLRP